MDTKIVAVKAARLFMLTKHRTCLRTRKTTLSSKYLRHVSMWKEYWNKGAQHFLRFLLHLFIFVSKCRYVVEMHVSHHYCKTNCLPSFICVSIKCAKKYWGYSLNDVPPNNNFLKITVFFTRQDNKKYSFYGLTGA